MNTIVVYRAVRECPFCSERITACHDMARVDAIHMTPNQLEAVRQVTNALCDEKYEEHVRKHVVPIATLIPPVLPGACTTAADTHAPHSPHQDDPKP